MSIFVSTDLARFVNERVVGLSVQSSTTALLPVGEACNVTTAVPTGTQEVYVKKGKTHWFSDHQNEPIKFCNIVERTIFWMSRDPRIQNVKMELFIKKCLGSNFTNIL